MTSLKAPASMFPLRDANPRHRMPVVTYALLALNTFVYVYQRSLGLGLAGERFVFRWAFVPVELVEQPLAHLPNLFTSLFLHGNFVHLFGNMLFLLVFADNIEDKLGRGRFVLFYLIGGAVASLGHAVFSLDRSLPLIGASGAISAVLGAYIMLFPRQRVLTFIPPLFLPWLVLRLFLTIRRFWLLWLPAWLFLGYWALIQVSAAAAAGTAADTSNVAWWAHVAGFAFGVVTVRWFRPRQPRAS